MSRQIPITVFLQKTHKEQATFITSEWKSIKAGYKNPRYYILMNTPVDEQSNTYIQIAKDVTDQHVMIEKYQKNLLTVLIIGILGSALVGIIVTRKSIKPLRDITKSTQRITISRLKERLDPSSLPKELAQLATAFNSMLDRIEDGFNRLYQFSSNLAHEFRTPIATLMGEAEVTLSRTRTNEEYRETIESSLEELTRLSHIIENLLFLARSENPTEAIKRSLINVREILDSIRDFYTIVADEKNITISCMGNTEIMADSLMLRRAVSNLVNNALRYTKQNGNIILDTRILENKYVSISVSDDGEGISSEHIPHLENRFYRVDEARSQRTGGTGLGLAIVKSIMVLHKGLIKIKSELNKGTTVTLIFPTIHSNS